MGRMERKMGDEGKGVDIIGLMGWFPLNVVLSRMA
jgi:hypothetical protein